MRGIFSGFIFFFFCITLKANLNTPHFSSDIPRDNTSRGISFHEIQVLDQTPACWLNENADSLSLSKKDARRKKIISAIFAFPFPFGMIGVHRIYLGTKPFIPIIYIATLGGCFGILPFIDFVVILAEKDLSFYDNNGKIFMWVR